DLVLDPFAGSGTTGTVARAYGRRSIGIEQSEQTAASAWQRITEVGMCRKGVALGQSSAIFGKRAGKKS
ncbi:MAG: site-specific DNA-methyltransferase, partial [Phycisphaerae bacterium]|nr:site-specific DNA-methyltransferase [Phycisphaerae bacterium]